MDSVALLNKAANLIPFIKFDSLEIGREYSIDRFELIADTKFGPSIVVYIDGDMLYLPKRFLKIFKTAEQIENLNKKNHVMTYNGRDPLNSNRILVEFDVAENHGDTVDGVE